MMEGLGFEREGRGGLIQWIDFRGHQGQWLGPRKQWLRQLSVFNQSAQLKTQAVQQLSWNSWPTHNLPSIYWNWMSPNMMITIIPYAKWSGLLSIHFIYCFHHDERRPWRRCCTIYFVNGEPCIPYLLLGHKSSRYGVRTSLFLGENWRKTGFLFVRIACHNHTDCRVWTVAQDLLQLSSHGHY